MADRFSVCDSDPARSADMTQRIAATGTLEQIGLALRMSFPIRLAESRHLSGDAYVAAQQDAHLAMLQSQGNTSFDITHRLLGRTISNSDQDIRLSTMSRVHLKFVRDSSDETLVTYNVLSPDFSESSIDEEVIGTLSLRLRTNQFSFDPVDKLRAVFCPPEWFEEYGGDFEQVNVRCAAQHYRCSAWAYLVYRKARQMLETKHFERITNAVA